MIITRQKKLDDILSFIKNIKTVFLVGCSLCATTCATGGEKELDEMEEYLKKNGKDVSGKAVLDPTCNILEIKRFSRKYAEEIDKAGAFLSMSCGGGTQAIAEFFGGKKVYPCNDSLFQGEITKISPKGGNFEQKCSLCGDCMLSETAGVCPVTRCPKGLRNGPCGGVKNGKCETDPNMHCVWLKIYDRLKEQDEVAGLKNVRLPRDYSKNPMPQKLEVKKDRSL